MKFFIFQPELCAVFWLRNLIISIGKSLNEISLASRNIKLFGFALNNRIKQSKLHFTSEISVVSCLGFSISMRCAC